MKKVLSVFLSIIMLFSFTAGIDLSAYADSNEYDYTLLEDGAAEIYKYRGSAANVIIPSKIDGYTVTSIGSDSFRECTSIINVTIPDSVKIIDDYAFNDCIGLTDITIPSSVTSIGEYAFCGCISLKSAVIPNSVLSIGYGVFLQCSSLENVVLPDSVQKIGGAAFQETAIYYNNWIDDVLYIGNHLIDARGSEEIYIDKNVVTIADGAFNGCGVTNINVDVNNKNYSSKNGVLYNKKQTELIQYPLGKTDDSFIIPNTVVKIRGEAFEWCDSLTNVTIPDSVTSIARYAFGWCTNLSKISMSKNIVDIYSDSFEGTEYYNNKNNWSNGVLYIGNCLIKADEEVAFGKYSVTEGTTVIAGSAFMWCRGLTDISIPNSVKSIGTYAFDDCEGLTNITLSNNISTIKSGTFCDCESLTSIVIPNGVTSIEDWAFQECTSLENITIPNSVKTIGKNAFFIPYGGNIIFIVEEGSYAEEYAYNNYYEYKYDINGETIKYPGYNDYLKTCEKLKEILPSAVSVNYNELEAEDKMSEIEKSIDNTLKSIYTKSNIDTKRYSVYVNYNPFPYESFRKATIYLEDSLNSNSWDWAEIKAIDVKFKNSDKYNKSDEQYIKNYQAPNVKYVEVDLDYLKSDDIWKEFRKATITAYEKAVTDSSITVLPISRAGAGDPGLNIGECEGSYISIFKNGVCYDIRRVENRQSVPVITVPSSVSDKEITDYAIEKIKEVYPNMDFTKKVIGIEQGFSYWVYDDKGNSYRTKIEYPNGYSYLFDFNGSTLSSNIIIRKECKHTWDNGKVTKKATCKATGIKTYTCTKCGETKAETIAKTAHTYKTTTTKATTKKNGSKVTKCSVCGAKKSSTTIYYPKTITLSKTSYVYNGKAQKPTVTVKDSKDKKIAASNYTVKYTNNKNVGKATVTITFKGNYSGTVKKTFTIKPKATTLSSITAKSKGFTAKWKKQATQTTGYQIQYSTDKNFKKNNKTVTVSKNSTTSKTVSKLNAKKKYYVRVRTYKTVKVNGKSTKIYSDWSKAKVVTTKK